MKSQTSSGPQLLRHKNHLSPLFLASFLLFCTLVVYANDNDWDLLNQGNIVIESIKDKSGVSGVRAKFVVRSSRDDVWAAFVDYDNFTQLFVNINKLKILDSSKHGVHIEVWVNAILTEINYVLYREYKVPGHELTWKRVSGDLKKIYGSWRIADTPDPEIKLLIYESYVDTGSPLMSLMVKLATRQKTEDMARRIRQRVEMKTKSVNRYSGD